MKHALKMAAASLLLLGACSDGASYKESAADMAVEPAPMAAAPQEMREQSYADGAPADKPQASKQYIAYTHSLGLRLPATEVEPVMQGHVAACKAAGTNLCMVTNSYINAYSDENISASLNLRASPEWIDKFLGGVDAEADAAKGEVINRNTSAEDLTVSIIDTGARLNAQQTLQRRLEELLENRPGSLAELLETERELARVNGDIDSLKSTLAALRQRVDMSVLTVGYESKREPISRSAFSPLGEAFGGFFHNLASALAAVITAFAIGLPWLILIGVLLAVWLRLIWPRIRRKKT